MGDYKTKCPGCGGDGCLEVTGGHFQATGMALTEDGFSFMDAKQIATEDEKVT